MIFSQNMICRESTFCGVYLLHISDDVGAIQNYSPFSLTNKTVGITFDPLLPPYLYFLNFFNFIILFDNHHFTILGLLQNTIPVQMF